MFRALPIPQVQTDRPWRCNRTFPGSGRKVDVEDRITPLRPVLDAQKITGLFPSGISGQPVNRFPKEGIKQKIRLHGTDNDGFPLLINIFPEGDVLQERPDVNERSNLFSFPLL
jgi:hypothetical protein